MQHKKRLFAAGVMPMFMIFMAVLLAACGGNTTPPGTQGQPASADKQVFRYPNGVSDFITLDPALSQYSNSILAEGALFSRLVALNPQNQVVDQLAQSHEVSADGLTYTFHLRNNLKFSDGSPLTADDVVYSINRAIDPATKSQVSYYLGEVKGYDAFQSKQVSTLIGTSLIAKDSQTVEIITGRPVGFFLAALTYVTSMVVNKKLIAKYGDQWTDHMQEGGSSGAFMVQSYSHTVGLTAVPNPYFYGPAPKLQKLQFLISGDIDPTYKAYMANQFDFTGIPPVNLAQAKTRKDYHHAPSQTTWYVALNYMTPPFDNIKIRQAFDLAINKDLLNKSALRGAQKPSNNIVPPGSLGYNPDLKGPDGTTNTSGNPDLAKKLLQEGMQEKGYKSISDLPQITLTNRVSTTLGAIAAVLIQQWQDVLGITVKQDVFELAKFEETLRSARNNAKGTQMWIAGWGEDYPDPQDWLSIMFGKGANYNDYNYGQNNGPTAADQAAVQDQLSKADVMTGDQNARLKIYQDAEQKVVTNVGWLVIYNAQSHFLLNPKIVNFPDAGQIATAWPSIYVSQ